MNFSHIIGNDNIKQLLSNSIKANNILHSYMFIGNEGIGKSLFASEFAKMILCNASTPNEKSCDNCNSCIGFNTNNHPDFMIVDLEDSKSIKIDQIRYLQEKIAEKPIVSNRKVYIINNSDTMTKEAQNCLLKTLEEPPSYAVIILISSNESNLLNTIKSRCTKISFTKLNNDEILDYFKRNNIEFNFNQNILQACNGSIGKAIRIKDESNNYNIIDDVLNNIRTKDISYIWNNSEILYKSKDSIDDLLDYINIILMNKLLSTNDIRYVNCVKIVEKTKKKLSSNANYDMSIDNMLLNIWEEFNEEYCWN